MKELKNRIDFLIQNSNGDKHIIEAIKNDKSVAPFSTENRLLAYFLSLGELSFDSYSKLCQEYYERSQKSNQYLYLFDMAPRTFGQTWGEQHIKKLFPEFIKATKENLATRYPNFDGEFDLWIDGIRVEVKACRANSTTTKGSLSSRAYTHDEAVAANFKYHYQQLKPSCCDVFIWIGVCKDALIYWVLTSEELQQTGKLGSQHRNENTGVEGAEVFEGQVFMTEEELKHFLFSEDEILVKVKEKGNKK
ncbi:MAG: restriction endonuclease subunit M [Spirochaetia bacterium]|nr:restriction endonuclease subunit M [Spirochaetia bacterium]